MLHCVRFLTCVRSIHYFCFDTVEGFVLKYCHVHLFRERIKQNQGTAAVLVKGLLKVLESVSCSMLNVFESKPDPQTGLLRAFELHERLP
jgi:hypothetical protein